MFRVAAWSCGESTGLEVRKSHCPSPGLSFFTGITGFFKNYPILLQGPSLSGPKPRDQNLTQGSVLAPKASLHPTPSRCHRYLSPVSVLFSPSSRCSSESQRVRNWNVAATSPEGSGVMTSSSRRLSRGGSVWPQTPGPRSSSTSRESGAAAAIAAAVSASQWPRPR